MAKQGKMALRPFLLKVKDTIVKYILLKFVKKAQSDG